MHRFIASYSSFLSILTVVLIATSVTVTLWLEKRATWSGGVAPATWADTAANDDVFVIPGRDIAYWGDPAARYSKYATRKRRKPIGIIVHYTAAKPVENLVNYGHISDPNRGGASFGYHFYIGRDGVIVQGAPLSRRTNHIKFSSNKQRRGAAKHLWSGNTIGISMVGGCDPVMRPVWSAWARCSDEFVTKSQIDAGLKVIRALQDHFGMPCRSVFGHGELQFDRERFEGYRLSRLVRDNCAPPVLPVPKPGVQVTAPKDVSGSAAPIRAYDVPKSPAAKSDAGPRGASG